MAGPVMAGMGNDTTIIHFIKFYAFIEGVRKLFKNKLIYIMYGTKI